MKYLENKIINLHISYDHVFRETSWDYREKFYSDNFLFLNSISTFNEENLSMQRFKQLNISTKRYYSFNGKI